MNKIIIKLFKKKFFNNLIDKANKRNLYEILEYLIKKHDKNALKNLLRRRLREWLDKAKKLRLQEILYKLILKLIYNSEDTIPAVLRKWRKNSRLLECDENSRIIQKFCRKCLDKVKTRREEQYLKRINKGLIWRR